MIKYKIIKNIQKMLLLYIFAKKFIENKLFLYIFTFFRMDKSESKMLTSKNSIELNEYSDNDRQLGNINSSSRCIDLASIKKRHILTVFAFFGFLFAYALRANLSIAIIDMAKINSKSNSNGTLDEWSPALKGYVLSSFFYGYIVTQLPAGINRFMNKLNKLMN